MMSVSQGRKGRGWEMMPKDVINGERKPSVNNQVHLQKKTWHVARPPPHSGHNASTKDGVSPSENP